MKLTKAIYSELRESLWQARKHCEEKYLDIGPEDSKYVIIATHSWSHDEWSTGEFAWCLGNRLEVRALIPTSNDFMYSSPFYTFMQNAPPKNIIELGGIRRKTLEIDSKELNLLRLAYLYFKKCNLDVNPVRFHSALYNAHSTMIGNFLRLEIPQRWRRSFKNSYSFYKILEGLVEIIINLELPEINRCRLCGESILNDAPIYLKALGICELHNCGAIYSIPLQEVLSQGKLFIDYPVELLRRCLRRKTFKCIRCGKRSKNIFQLAICDDCMKKTGLLGTTTIDDIFKLACLEKLNEDFKVKRRADPRTDRNSRMDISIVERTCVDCKESFLIKRLHGRIEDYLCPECRSRYDLQAINYAILSHKLTRKDFLSMPELREQYLGG